MQTPLWIDAYGNPIRLSDMTTEHVRNAWRYVHRGNGKFGPLLRWGCSGFSNSQWLDLFAAELRRRARLGEVKVP
jgi:hypothetical protein